MKNVRDTRRKLGLNQFAFWGPIQVTQSGGSRYEAGRSMPKPVKLLLDMAYGTERRAQELLAAIRAGNTQLGEVPEEVRPYFVVVAGTYDDDTVDAPRTITYSSKAMSNFDTALADYTEVTERFPDQKHFWCEIEYHINMAEKQVFIPVLAKKVVL